MPKRREPRKNLRASTWVWIGGAAALVAVGAGAWFLAANASRPPASNVSALDVAASLPSSDTAFNVGSRIGKPAPAFTVTDAQSNPYAFQPGDGRKYVLAFNMGYV